MNALTDLSLKTDYHKGIDDVAATFYLPCMSAATSYDRAVGFFSSSIYVLAWPALKDFVARHGHMRIVCSPVLNDDDIEALRAGYTSELEREQAGILREEVRRMLSDPTRGKATQVFATLVALGVIDLRIAFMQQDHYQAHQRLFHDKLGLFKDTSGNIVAFKGSMNETWSGLSPDGNLESIDVFLSWADERDRERVANHVRTFEQLWENEYPTVIVKKFPEVAQDELIRAADRDTWEGLVDDICDGIEESARLSADISPGGKRPRDHQVRYLKAWFEHQRRGIFEHATGSGKTFTALCAIRDSLGRHESVLILVPSDLLLQQWGREVAENLADVAPNVLLCGGGHTEWRTQTLLSAWTKPRSDGPPRVVIATMQTASSEDFLALVRPGEHLFFVADEVHRLGSPQHQHILDTDSGPRLGLSATPRRAGDPLGTQRLLDYFEGIIPPPFTLADAIAADTLTPYFYYPHPVHLTSDEQEEWNDITKRIRPLQARHVQSPDPSLQARIKILLIQRARITKTASGKVDLAAAVVQKHYSSGQRWIVYCDSQPQVADVLRAIQISGLRASEYHSAMQGDRATTLRHFEATGGILVSIRCLDEGVDIPSVTHALILASSKNPREFIQRRGRVLRRAQGKTLAFLHDAIVVPKEVAPDQDSDSVLLSELARAIQFGRAARNSSSIQDLELIALRAGIDCTELFEQGFEDDESTD